MLRSIARCAKPLAAASPLRTPVAARAPLLLNAGRRCMSTFEKEEDIDVDSVSYGFMASQAVFTGLELGIYDAIADAGEKGLTLADIQKSSGVSAPRLQTLLTSLTSIKSLKRTADGIYTNSPNSSKYLVTSSRAYYGDYLRYQMGRQFYHRMGALPEVMSTGIAPNYASWFSDPETANTYTQAQHNGSVATAKYMVKKKLSLEGVTNMLDVGGGSGAFSYVFTGATPGLTSTVLELPEVCKTGESIKASQSADVQSRVKFVELDATSPDWPVSDSDYEVVLMSCKRKKRGGEPCTAARDGAATRHTLTRLSVLLSSRFVCTHRHLRLRPRGDPWRPLQECVQGLEAGRQAPCPRFYGQ